ncbi:hypothetical protein F5884DRAFT_262298 [Xylogone sp. PMI_703]|nr:hypothetical protein F5884DRAFT_262298 [Xylogone sp. PMI_703]
MSTSSIWASDHWWGGASMIIACLGFSPTFFSTSFLTSHLLPSCTDSSCPLGNNTISSRGLLFGRFFWAGPSFIAFASLLCACLSLRQRRQPTVQSLFPNLFDCLLRTHRWTG